MNYPEYIIRSEDGRYEQAFTDRDAASKYVQYLELAKEVDPQSIQFQIRRKKSPGRPTSTQ